jgi:peroxiredoxin
MKELKDLNVRPSTPITLYKEDRSKITTDDLFPKGKKVVLIGLPGAYTPVCSKEHIPEFVKNFDKLKSSGIDSIVCVSINDAFVLEAWGKSLHSEGKVSMIADPSGEFARQIGAEVDLSGAGLGKRSERYTMLIDNGKPTLLNVEKSPGECKLSHANTIISQIVKK